MRSDGIPQKGKISTAVWQAERVRTCGGEVPNPQGCPQPRVVGRVLVHGGGLRGLVERLFGCLVVPFRRNGRPRLLGGLGFERWAFCDLSKPKVSPVFWLSFPPPCVPPDPWWVLALRLTETRLFSGLVWFTVGYVSGVVVLASGLANLGI